MTRKFGLSVGEELGERLDDYPPAFDSRAAWIRHLVRIGLAAHEPLSNGEFESDDIRTTEAVVRQAILDYLERSV